MSWLELIMSLLERNEKILEHRASEVLTIHEASKTGHRYYRVNGLFTQDNEEGFLDIVYGRGGSQYMWRKKFDELPHTSTPETVIVNDEVG